MTIRVTGTEIVTVTPQMARRLLHDNVYPKQRGVNTQRVDQYRRDIEGDDWTPGTVLKFAVLDGKNYMINGQHRLQAIILSGTPIEMVRIDMEAETEDELAKLYYNEDMGLPRSFGQMFRSLEVGDKLGVPDYLARRAGHAINLIKYGWKSPKSGGLTRDEILHELMNNYGEALARYRSAVMVKVGGIYSQLWRSPVCALGIEIYRYACEPADIQRANDFWSGLALDDGLRIGDPRKVAHDHIVTTTLGDDEARGQRITREYQVRYLATCWNKWCDREVFALSKTGFIRISDPNGPIKITGTPWDGTKEK